MLNVAHASRAIPALAPKPEWASPHVLAGPTAMRVDPTGRVVVPEVPDNLLQRWRDDRAGLAAEAAEAASRHAAELAVRDARIGKLLTLVNDGYMIAQDLRGLVYLFEKAVVDDGPESPLTTASHIVVDCIRSMATRLENLEAQAWTSREEGPAS